MKSYNLGRNGCGSPKESENGREICPLPREARQLLVQNAG